MRSRRSGFTLLEMLVVIGLIIGMTTLAAGAYSAFLRAKTIQMGTRVVSNALRTARQYAVSKRTPCLVVFLRPNDCGLTTCNHTSCGERGEPESLRDSVQVIPFVRKVDAETGSITYQLSHTPIVTKSMPGQLQFSRVPPYQETDENGTSTVTAITYELDGGALLDTDPYDGPYGSTVISAILFSADGAAQVGSYDESTPLCKMNYVVEIRDPEADNPSEGEYERSRIFVYRVTGYAREWYDIEPLDPNWTP